MSESYRMTIAGCERELPRFAVSESLDIAAFILFGDVEITVASAAALLQKAPAFDVLFTAEAKSIPLIYEMARQSGKPYAVARKRPKVYMTEPVSVEVQSITTKGQQLLWLGQEDIAAMAGKRVLIVDDVISTGESLRALEALAALTQATVVGKCAILAEGDAADRTDIFFLEKLPLFFK